MNKLIAIALTLSAGCATTTPTGLPRNEPSSPRVPPPALQIGVVDEATPIFPVQVSAARAPHADRLRLELRATGHERPSGVFRVCVAPDGATVAVSNERSTGVAELDRALRLDLAAWRYQPYTAPAKIRVCRRIHLTYVP